MNEVTIFHGALEIANSHARAAYLDQACGGDADLRRRVEELLDAHFRTAPFMDRAASELLDQAEAPADGKAGTVIAGRFTLVEPIGAGAGQALCVSEVIC